MLVIKIVTSISVHRGERILVRVGWSVWHYLPTSTIRGSIAANVALGITATATGIILVPSGRRWVGSTPAVVIVI